MTSCRNQTPRFVICVSTDDPDLLTPRMIYQVLPDESAARSDYVRVIDNGGEEAIDEMFAAEGVANGLEDESGQPLRGPAGFKPFFRKFREAFPEIEVVVEDAIAEGEKVAARCTVRGRHRG